MDFFFVQDHRQKYRYFSSEAQSQIQVDFSRLRKFWEKAKKKLLLLLPSKILKQEQAFERTLRMESNEIRILYSGRLNEKKIASKFYFFLQRQRSKHIFLLIGELILMPITGIAALLPGPNIIFYVLALLFIIQWQALRGINRLVKKKQQFVADQALKDWETALQDQEESALLSILEKIEKQHSLNNIKKILWK